MIEPAHAAEAPRQAGSGEARRLPAADATARAAGVARAYKMPVQGIDVSRWQGTIDWDRVGAAGTRFAYIKATEGGDHLDPRAPRRQRVAPLDRGKTATVFLDRLLCVCRLSHVIRLARGRIKLSLNFRDLLRWQTVVRRHSRPAHKWGDG